MTTIVDFEGPPPLVGDTIEVDSKHWLVRAIHDRYNELNLVCGQAYDCRRKAHGEEQRVFITSTSRSLVNMVGQKGRVLKMSRHYYLQGEMKHLLRSFGMTDVLGHLISALPDPEYHPDGDEEYMVRLRADLVAVFDNYARRYDGTPDEHPPKLYEEWRKDGTSK
jgi:hypothetical protein